MGKFIDITGEVFGKITVVRRLDEKTNGHILWECKCECGNHINKTRPNLIKMKNKCCSECYKINLTGKRFGKLTVLEEAKRVNIGALKSRAWKCQCDCGGTVNCGNGVSKEWKKEVLQSLLQEL